MRLAILVSLSLALGGCAVTPKSSDHRATANRIYQESTDLSGRLSIRYQSNGKDEAMHGSFIWNQTPAKTKITLLSPLGQTIADIKITAEEASLRRSNDIPRAAANADELVADTLGWPLPIAGLRSWLQGFGTGANGNAFVASPQTSEITTRDGWHLVYANWQDSPAGQIRPKRIDLERQTAQAGNVSIRIVIDSWQQ